jgi:hypothetical protein
MEWCADRRYPVRPGHYHISSPVGGRVAGPTLRAVDEETVHSVILGVQQDRSTVSAQIVNGVFVVDFAWSPFFECRRAYSRL